MTRGQAKRIEEIIRNQDVRDPRLTLDAIAAILAEKPSIKPEQSEPQTSAFEKLMEDLLAMQVEGDDPAEIPHVEPDDVKNEFGNPVSVFRIYNTKEIIPGKLNVKVALDYCDAHLEPRHFKAIKRTIKAFALEKVAELTAGLEAGQ